MEKTMSETNDTSFGTAARSEHELTIDGRNTALTKIRHELATRSFDHRKGREMKSLAHPNWPYTGTPHEWRGFAEKEMPKA
jgi:hypothetical protein